VNTPNTKPRTLARLIGLIVTLLAPLAALAQDQYEPVNEAARQRMDPNPYIVGAYGFIWVAVLVYVVMVARGLGRARGEIEDLRRRVEASGS
jgi:CcmD family protein